jgi:hypothetical protein
VALRPLGGFRPNTARPAGSPGGRSAVQENVSLDAIARPMKPARVRLAAMASRCRIGANEMLLAAGDMGMPLDRGGAAARVLNGRRGGCFRRWRADRRCGRQSDLRAPRDRGGRRRRRASPGRLSTVAGEIAGDIRRRRKVLRAGRLERERWRRACGDSERKRASADFCSAPHNRHALRKMRQECGKIRSPTGRRANSRPTAAPSETDRSFARTSRGHACGRSASSFRYGRRTARHRRVRRECEYG